jgi:DNA polymerase-4
MARVIALTDMNSFFASCHQASHPELAGREVIVAGDPQKRTGIVLAASYPAKARGIKIGMALWEAKQLCPCGHFFKPVYSLTEASLHGR